MKSSLSKLAMSGTSLAAKFRGCLVGGLTGDCLGAPFEGEKKITQTVLTNFIVKRLEKTDKSQKITFN